MENIQKINVTVTTKFSWKTVLLVAAAFCIGDLCGRFSMANYYESKKETKDGSENN